MTLSKGQIGYAWSLLRNCGFEETEDKEAYISEITGGRTVHISEMTYQEMQKLVAALDGDRLQKRTKMINKVLSLAHEMRWELPGGKIDMERVNNFCKTRTPGKVGLDKTKYSDLPKVVTIFEKMHMEFLKGL